MNVMTPSELGETIEAHIRSLLIDRPSLYREMDTALVNSRLCNLGQSLGFEVLASRCASSNGVEWLYDMVWATYEPEHTMPSQSSTPNKLQIRFLIRQAMIMELEWRLNRPETEGRDVDEDFQKLVQGRADIRMWIYRVRTPAPISGLNCELVRSSLPLVAISTVH
jgi:hypothetical protein